MTTTFHSKLFSRFVFIFATLLLGNLYADDSRSATVSEESPNATIQAFSHLRYKTPVFKRFLTVSTDDDSVFKKVEKVSGDASTMWMLVVDCDTQSLPHTFEDNKPSTINYDGTNDPDAECKMYQPTFSGTAIPTGEGGGEPQEYSWNVTTDGQNAVYDFDLKLDGKSEEEEETSPGVLIGCNGGRKALKLTAKPKELGGKVKLTLSAGLKLYENATGGNPISIPADGWSPQQLEEKTYYVGGISGSASMGDQKCEATWEGDNFTTITDKAVATVIEVDIKLEGLSDDKEEDEPGVLLRKANDETESTIETKEVTVSIKPSSLNQGILTLTVPSTVSAWKDKNRSASAELSWNLSNETLGSGKKIYCSGTNIGSGEFVLSHDTTGATDKAKSTVYELNLVIDNLKENVEENPGVSIDLFNRKILVMKATPSQLNGNVQLTLSDKFLLYSTASADTPIAKRQWSINELAQSLTYYLEADKATDSNGENVVLKWTGNNSLNVNDTVKVKVKNIIAVKIPLGKNVELNKYKVGKIYVPTKWGGQLQVSDGTLYYTDGSDLSQQTIRKIVKGELTALTNPYTVPENKHGWYYAYKNSTDPINVSNNFVQSAQADKQPWNCPWYPMADDMSTNNLYETGGALDKYDQAFGTTSCLIEKRNWLMEGGHFFAKQTIIESDAERTVGYDYDNADHDDNTKTGWDQNVAKDIINSSNNVWGQDGNTNGTMGVGWYGHCDMASAAIILENEPSNAEITIQGVKFNQTDKKGLLIALYHSYSLDNSFVTFTFDVVPSHYHPFVEQKLFFEKKMFCSDITNTGSDGDVVWNYPIYKTHMSYAEHENDINKVTVKCKVFVWKSSTTIEEKTYEYRIKYKSNGMLDDSINGEWITELTQRPDTAWIPVAPTTISPFWNNELNINNLNHIIGR